MNTVADMSHSLHEQEIKLLANLRSARRNNTEVVETQIFGRRSSC